MPKVHIEQYFQPSDTVASKDDGEEIGIEKKKVGKKRGRKKKVTSDNSKNNIKSNGKSPSESSSRASQKDSATSNTDVEDSSEEYRGVKNGNSQNTRSKRHSPRLIEEKYESEMGLQSSPVIWERKVNDNGEGGGILAGCVIQKGGRKEFIEPQLAEPEPAYTGLPLEAFPNTKIKKESLWPSRGTGRRGPKNGAAKADSDSQNVEASTDRSSMETEYRHHLKTNYYDELKTESDIRRIGRPIRDNQSKDEEPKKRHVATSAKTNLTKTPRQTKHKPSDLSNSVRSSKRIKVISPKKSASTNLAPTSGAGTVFSEDRDDGPTKDNDDFCSTCGGPGIFICCDSCTKSFHFTCCEPPLEECPEDSWNCRECVYKLNPGSRVSWNDIGVFGQLINQTSSRNPIEFQLPKRLRENTFVGVTTGDNGIYKDTSEKEEMTPSKLNGSQLPGYNMNKDLEIDKLYDKDGNPYLCHKCGLSGLKNRTLTHCDYCPLVWHLDCLDYPLCIPKSLGSKWRCPNHFEELLPEGLYSKRIFKDAQVIDSSLHSQFLKLASMRNFIIKYDNQPYLNSESGNPATLQAYIQYESDDFSRPDIQFKREDTPSYVESITLSKSNNQGDTHPDFKIPDFFQNISTSHGTSAKASQKLSKIISLTDSNEETNSSAFIYRIPEKSIELDFISKVSDEKAAANQRLVSVTKKDVMGELEDYAARERVESNEVEREFVESLSQVKQGDSLPLRKPKLNFDELVKAALKDESMCNNKRSTELKEDEIEDLLRIKQLMEIKGKEKLLQFLEH
ncbi:Piso0_003293 [Millerozyma farinosa CBS 7064]|uniref:Piso0_003293 protein n=1 Tax=Pichia sorbitophila (strain ATCC MYA-4447 / BCRC 22081 / CBS 7064 / NBRC 10061 / NRRL Y-12695) TaxID=559304 RepID=G8YHQ4_PICSO|nr:Piso0_003293 [Millerozyma farinosa CBS 7064]CCE80956.1 Piso0_003293 [Millerozyma farinosa CBS 7064]